jgi:hypothetical protein
VSKAIAITALALLFMCTALLLVIRGTRVIVALSIQILFVVAVVAGTVWYVLGEVGAL